LIFSSSIEDGEFLATWDVDCLGANLVDHLVDESGISESSSSHDFIVSSSCTVSIEVLLLDASLVEVSSSRGVLGDSSSWGDVIGSDGIT